MKLFFSHKKIAGTYKKETIWFGKCKNFMIFSYCSFLRFCFSLGKDAEIIRNISKELYGNFLMNPENENVLKGL
jgi:hypothetical protein